MISYRYVSEKFIINPDKKDSDNDIYWRELPSHDSRKGMAPKKKVYTSNHTIAPAYNKGPYQVISSVNLKDIGK